MNNIGRLIKYFLIFLIVVFIAIIAFVATFDANNYKPQIIEQVENATGRDFTIGGDINLSVFPWVGLKVDDVALGNEKGFKAKQFAAIKQLDIKVNVLPLLKKEVQINTIRLHGLNVSLEVAKNSSNNWSGLTEPKAGTDAPAADKGADKKSDDEKAADKTVTDPMDADAGASPLESLKVEGFEFVDASIHYDDRSSGMQATVSELNLTTSAIEFDQPVNVEFGARVENNQPVIDSRLKLTTDLTFNKEFTKINLSDFVFTLLAEANEFIKQNEEITLASSIDVLMDEQRITLKNTKIMALGTTTQADITVSQFLKTPLIQGSVEVLPFNAREVAGRVGVALPEMAKADALQQVGLSTNIKLQGEKFEANDFVFKLDGSTLSGWVHLLNISKQQLRYELAFDALNVNDYLPPVAESVDKKKVVAKAPANAPANAGTGAGAGEGAVPAASGDEKIELPLELMRSLDIQGDFRIATLKALEYEIKQLLMTVKAEKGEINIKPLSLQVLQGQVNSAVKVNVQKTLPAYGINLDVNQVQVGPVANPFLDGLMGEKPLKMEGAVNLSMDVKTNGDSVNQLKKASKGQIVLDMKKTRVDGFDPEFYMRSSIADYLHSKGFGLSKTIMGDYQPRDVTVFDKIHSTVKLADGKARTDDFIMDSKRVQVGAKGYADIMVNKMDVMSSVRLPRGKTALEKVLDEPVYVRVHGPFEALQFELDKDRLKKSTSDVLENEAKAKAKEKIDEEKQRLQEKADAEKKRAEEKVEAEKKRAEEKLKDKLKDKFKNLF